MGTAPLDRSAIDALARAGQIAHWAASGLTPPDGLGDDADAWRAAVFAIVSLATMSDVGRRGFLAVMAALATGDGAVPVSPITDYEGTEHGDRGSG